MYTIKTRAGSLGCIHDGKSYVVGFNNIGMVSKASRVMKTNPVVKLNKVMTYDVTDDVKNGLKALGFDEPSFTSITIDTEALLTIEKDITRAHVMHKGIEISLYDAADFLYLTFEKHLGLIMPYEEYFETEDKLVYKSSVIDPSLDIDIFRKNLSL